MPLLIGAVNDGRAPVANVAEFPWRCIAYLLIEGRDGRYYQGSGCLVGPRTILTAGHCVYALGQGFMGRISVFLGANGLQAPVYGGMSQKFQTVSGWARAGDPSFDYGAIILSDPVGNSLGWFGVEASTDEELAASAIVISGYPIDEPPRTQWFAEGRVSNTTPTRVRYSLFTAEGESGSPIFRREIGGPFVVAVHAYGEDNGFNFGVRVTGPMHQRIHEWT